MLRLPIAIDLFSGCGGLTLGLKQAGFTVIGAVELDSLAVETYKLNHDNVYVWEKDIREICIDDVLNTLNIKPGDLDLLAGCPPCQGFSSVRTLNGKMHIDDDRNELVFEFGRFVRGLKPKAFMMENVPGLMKDARLLKLRAELEAIGYNTDCQILNAADYGVPQRRRRMFLIGGFDFKPEFDEKDILRNDVAGAIRELPKPGDPNDELHTIANRRTDRIKKLIKKIPKNGGSRRDLGEDEQLDCHKNCDGFKDIYGRMKWDDQAPTITGGCTNPSKGRFLHPVQDREITLREAALLQSFPSQYKFSLKRGRFKVAEMIGNALPPELVRRQAHTLIDKLLEKG